MLLLGLVTVHVHIHVVVSTVCTQLFRGENTSVRVTHSFPCLFAQHSVSCSVDDEFHIVKLISEILYVVIMRHYGFNALFQNGTHFLLGRVVTWLVRSGLCGIIYIIFIC